MLTEMPPLLVKDGVGVLVGVPTGGGTRVGVLVGVESVEVGLGVGVIVVTPAD